MYRCRLTMFLLSFIVCVCRESLAAEWGRRGRERQAQTSKKLEYPLSLTVYSESSVLLATSLIFKQQQLQLLHHVGNLRRMHCLQYSTQRTSTQAALSLGMCGHSVKLLHYNCEHQLWKHVDLPHLFPVTENSTTVGIKWPLSKGYYHVKFLTVFFNLL